MGKSTTATTATVHTHLNAVNSMKKTGQGARSNRSFCTIKENQGKHLSKIYLTGDTKKVKGDVMYR